MNNIKGWLLSLRSPDHRTRQYRSYLQGKLTVVMHPSFIHSIFALACVANAGVLRRQVLAECDGSLFPSESDCKRLLR
jgi:hypothetical protein